MIVCCSDIHKIQDGIGDKVGTLIQWICGAIAGFVIGFVYGWKLTLVILAVSPLLVVSAGLFGKVSSFVCRLKTRPKEIVYCFV